MDLKRLQIIYRQEKSHVEEVNVRALIPVKHVGKIIGKQGGFSKQLINKYTTLFTITPPAWCGKRLLHTHTAPDKMKGLWRELLYMLMGTAPIPLRDPGVEFILPHGFILDLQENNDDEFKQMAIKSKCKFIIKKAYLPNSTEHIVRISVPTINEHYLYCFENAIYLLSINLNNYARSALAAPGNKFFNITKETEFIPYHHKDERHDNNDDEIIYDYEE